MWTIKCKPRVFEHVHVCVCGACVRCRHLLYCGVRPVWPRLVWCLLQSGDTDTTTVSMEGIHKRHTRFTAQSQRPEARIDKASPMQHIPTKCKYPTCCNAINLQLTHSRVNFLATLTQQLPQQHANKGGRAGCPARLAAACTHIQGFVATTKVTAAEPIQPPSRAASRLACTLEQDGDSHGSYSCMARRAQGSSQPGFGAVVLQSGHSAGS